MAKSKSKTKAAASSKNQMSIADKKDYAKMLYTVEGVRVQKELAERSGVSEQTISKWINKEKWDQLLGNIILTKEAEHRRLLKRLTFLNDTLDGLEEQYSDPETTDDGKDKIINRINKTSDSISKVGAGIRAMETETFVADAIEVMMGFLKFLRPIDPEIAKRVSHESDAYVKSLMK